MILWTFSVLARFLRAPISFFFVLQQQQQQTIVSISFDFVLVRSRLIFLFFIYFFLGGGGLISARPLIGRIRDAAALVGRDRMSLARRWPINSLSLVLSPLGHISCFPWINSITSSRAGEGLRLGGRPHWVSLRYSSFQSASVNQLRPVVEVRFSNVISLRFGVSSNSACFEYWAETLFNTVVPIQIRLRRFHLKHFRSIGRCMGLRAKPLLQSIQLEELPEFSTCWVLVRFQVCTANRPAFETLVVLYFYHIYTEN